MIGGLVAIQRDGKAIDMDCNGFVRYLNLQLEKKHTENLVF